MCLISDSVEASGDIEETFSPFHLALSADRSPITITSTLLIEVKNRFSNPRSIAMLMECLTAVGQVITTESNLDTDRFIKKSVNPALSTGVDVNNGTKTKSALSLYGRHMDSQPSDGARMATHFFISATKRGKDYLLFYKNHRPNPKNIMDQRQYYRWGPRIIYSVMISEISVWHDYTPL